MILWKTDENYLFINMKYPQYLIILVLKVRMRIKILTSFVAVYIIFSSTARSAKELL